jgi:hypothetical protein
MDYVKIGLGVFILVLIGVIVYMAIKKTKDEEEVEDVDPEEWPEPSYMDKIGKFCPTGWVYNGIKDGKDICINRYNIPVNTTYAIKYGGCYTKPVARIMEFPSFNNKNWADCLNDTSKCRRQVCPRKRWITRCGISPDQEAQWIGFDKLGTSCPKQRLLKKT